MGTLKDYQNGAVRFSSDLFSAGDSALAPVLCWEWLRMPTEDEVRTQLDAARRAGFGTVYILPMPREFRPHTMVTELKGYLTPRFFSAVKAALTFARSLGLHIWLYDEGGWPSGAACGLVCKGHPELRAHQLAGSKSGKVKVRVRPGGKPDIYSPAAAKRFVSLTHDAYARSLGALANEVDAMFTDEPAGFPDAWGDWLPELPKAQLLDALTSQNEQSSEAHELRKAYFAALKTQFCATMDTFRSACHDHGWLMTGHLDRDHTADSNHSKGYGNTLAALKTLDIPGVDAICGQIHSDGGSKDALPFYPRFASSAAVQNGTPLALSESFAVYGNALSGDEMRYILNAQLVRGINLFNFMLMPVTLERWYAYGERPFFHPSVPGFFALDSLCKELERESLFMATGLHCSRTALLYPYAEMLAPATQRAEAIRAFRAAGEALEAQGVDFDLIDIDTLRTAPLENGELSCGGAVYEEVVIPEGCAVPKDVERKLSALQKKTAPPVEIRDAPWLHRTLCEGDGTLHICLFNPSKETQTAHITVRTEKKLYRFLPKAGDVHPFENGDALTLTFGECALLLASNDSIATASAPVVLRKLPLKPLGANKVTEFRLSGRGAALLPADWPLPLPKEGDVSFPPDFCGEAVYSLCFERDGASDCLLSFQQLWHFAEVFVNEIRVGSVCTAPYTLRLPGALLRSGENRLTVRVSNLTAPAYCAAAPNVRFLKKHIGPYHTPALQREASISGGGFRGLTLEEIK